MSKSAEQLPNLDGLMLSQRGGNGSSFDLGDRVDDRVPADALVMGCERLGSSRVDEIGVFEHRVRECLGDEPVEPRIGRLVDGRPAVRALEIEHVDRVELGQLGDDLLRPFARRVELEPRGRVDVEDRPQRRDGGRLRQAPRDDEPHGRGRPAEHLGERLSRLPQARSSAALSNAHRR